MSKSAVCTSEWAEMTEAQRTQCVRDGQATLKDMIWGLLDGSDELRKVCHRRLKEFDFSEPNDSLSCAEQTQSFGSETAALENKKRRHGLPHGYTSRLNAREPI